MILASVQRWTTRTTTTAIANADQNARAKGGASFIAKAEKFSGSGKLLVRFCRAIALRGEGAGTHIGYASIVQIGKTINPNENAAA